MELSFDDIILDQGPGPFFKWFVAASALLHAVAFVLLVGVLPRIQAHKPPDPPVYTVNLVSLPPAPAPAPIKTDQPAVRPAKPEPAPAAEPKPEPAPAPKPEPAPEPAPAPEPEPAELVPMGPVKPAEPETEEIRKIEKEAPKPEAEPKEVEIEPPKPKPAPKPEPEPDPAPKPKPADNDRAIDQALARVQNQVQAQEEEAALEEAIAALAARNQGGADEMAGVRGSGTPSELDSRMRDYYILLYNMVTANWNVPPKSLLGDAKNIDAIYVVRIDRQGEVVDEWFERESGVAPFDQSARRAVARVKTHLPPLPDVWPNEFLEIGFRFTPSGVKRR